MKQSIADTLKLESNFCIKRLIRLCKDNCNYFDIIKPNCYFYKFDDNGLMSIRNNVIDINNHFVEFNKELTNGIDTFNILAKQK